MLKILLGIVLGLSIAYIPQSALEQVYHGYNNITIYEDGSYTSETREGQLERGCINNALCDSN